MVDEAETFMRPEKSMSIVGVLNAAGAVLLAGTSKYVVVTLASGCKVAATNCFRTTFFRYGID